MQYGLVIIFLIGATELHQFMQLPFLFTHYRQHQATDPDLGLLEFISLHYLHPQHADDGDDEQDRQLPFKSPGTLQHTDIPQWQQPQLLICDPPFSLYRHGTVHSSGPLSERSFAVFHPPKPPGT